MQKIQIFVGPIESGKTFMAREITKGQNTAWINGYRTNPFDHPTLLSVVGTETKYIVVDDIYGAENLRFWFLELRDEKLIIGRNTDAPMAINRPEIILICYASIAKVVNLDEYQEEFEIKEFTKKHIEMEKRYYCKITRENKPGNSIEKQLLQEIQMDERQIINRKALDIVKKHMQKWIEDIESQNKRCKPGMINLQWTSSSDKKDEFCYVGGLCTISFYLIEEKERLEALVKFKEEFPSLQNQITTTDMVFFEADQSIGSIFKNWADTYFLENANKYVELKNAFSDCIYNTGLRITTSNFIEKLKAYCYIKGYVFNPSECVGIVETTTSRRIIRKSPSGENSTKAIEFIFIKKEVSNA